VRVEWRKRRVRVGKKVQTGKKENVKKRGSIGEGHARPSEIKNAASSIETESGKERRYDGVLTAALRT